MHTVVAGTVIFTFYFFEILVEIEAGDSNTVYAMLIKILVEYNVPLNKLIGICSDGANTMRGVHKGVCIQLEKYLRTLREDTMHAIIVAQDVHIRRTIDSFHVSRGILSVHCVCHRLALVLTDAIKGTQNLEQCIPDNVIELLNMLYNYFARSPTRKKAMRELISFENAYNKRQATQRLQAERRRVPHPDIVRPNPVEELEQVMDMLLESTKLPRRIVLTRWLSCADAVRVVLNSRLVYINYFSNENNDKSVAILDLLEDSNNFAWYACMHDVLPVLTRMNVLFQSSLPLPHLLHQKITTAKATLINMVGDRATRTELLPLESVNVDTSFGAYANKFIKDTTGPAALHGSSLNDNEVLFLKKAWHKLYAHCLQQIDSRFPPENIYVFKLMQVLDPSVVHGVLRRELIGTDSLAVVVEKLLHIFEIPLHTSGMACLSTEEIKNSFVVFNVSALCGDLWREMTQPHNVQEQRRRGQQPLDYSLVYPYYRKLMLLLPDIKPWAMFALFVLVFPTGNAIAERGFSAMGATHTKQRSELGRDQVFANLIIGFNGPSVTEFTAQLDIESRQRHWPLYLCPITNNLQ